MEIISGITDFQLNDAYAVTIGKFDGIHRGHRELVDRIIKRKEYGMKTAVFTFDVSPLSFFAGQRVPSLTTNEEKRRIFEFLGIDTLIEYPLNEETAKISPERFIADILCKQMNMKYIAVGSDITFGHRGLGNAELLRVMSTKTPATLLMPDVLNAAKSESVSAKADIDRTCEENYICEVVDKLMSDGEEISSTLIRNVVAGGQMEKAARLIGVPYAVSGIVSEGKKLGRTIGFPTVNLTIPNDKLMPPNGVYFTEVSVLGRHLKGVTNIGTKPTVSSSDTVFAETHIFDFDEDIYGERITVKLLHFERHERKFESVELLKRQIRNDVKCAEDYFA